ncbi:sel1 repeat family protein [Pelomyxa schiedti]|nr:sel1 repeat family protein [Pelomyxa schiedti]
MHLPVLWVCSVMVLLGLLVGIDTAEGALCPNIAESLSGPLPHTFISTPGARFLLRCDGTGTLTLSTCGWGFNTELFWYNRTDCVNAITSDTNGCAEGSVEAIISNQPVTGGTDYVLEVQTTDPAVVVETTGGGSCANLVGPSLHDPNLDLGQENSRRIISYDFIVIILSDQREEEEEEEERRGGDAYSDGDGASDEEDDVGEDVVGGGADEDRRASRGEAPRGRSSSYKHAEVNGNWAAGGGRAEQGRKQDRSYVEERLEPVNKEVAPPTSPASASVRANGSWRPPPLRAAQESTTSWPEETMCGVCFEVVMKPVSLHCGHILCFKCLCGLASYSVLYPASGRIGLGGLTDIGDSLESRVSRVDSGLVQVQCPHNWCQKVTEVRLLDNNKELFVDSRVFPVLENVERNAEPYAQRLGLCEVGRCQQGDSARPQPATVICEECRGMILCRPCFDAQHTGGKFLDHTPITLQNNMKTFPFSRCNVHHSRELELWCTECSKPVCFFCARTDHGHHQTELIDDYFDSYKNKYAEALEKMRQLRSLHEQTLQVIQSETESLDALVMGDTQQIKDWFSSIREALATREENLIKELNSASNEIREKWRKQRISIASASNFLDQFIRRGETTANSAHQTAAYQTGSRLAFTLQYTEMETLLERSTRNILASKSKLRVENQNVSQVISEVPKIGIVSVENPPVAEPLSIAEVPCSDFPRPPVKKGIADTLPVTLSLCKSSVINTTHPEDFALGAIGSLAAGDLKKVYQCGQNMVTQPMSTLESLGHLLLRCVFSLQPQLFDSSTTWTFEMLLSKASASRHSHPNVLRLLTKVTPSPPQPAQQHPTLPQQLLTSASADEIGGVCHLMLGLINHCGLGVDKNVGEAVRHFKAAAKAGNSLGQFYLGYCYLKGQGVPRSHTEAMKLLEDSASKNNPMEASRLGSLYDPGFPPATTGTGTAIAKNAPLAVGYYQASSARHWAPGQDSLALCYQHGKGVGKNYEAAFDLFKRAAEQGFPNAQYHLGLLYESGVLGVVGRDMAEARKLFALAADQNHKDARERLGKKGGAAAAAAVESQLT